MTIARVPSAAFAVSLSLRAPRGGAPRCGRVTGAADVRRARPVTLIVTPAARLSENRSVRPRTDTRETTARGVRTVTGGPDRSPRGARDGSGGRDGSRIGGASCASSRRSRAHAGPDP